VSPHALHRHRDELRYRNCVDIDAGLPSESRESLKILHYLLDNARVAFVAISNRPLGTALRIGCLCVCRVVVVMRLDVVAQMPRR
jgi:hypothetical protein